MNTEIDISAPSSDAADRIKVGDRVTLYKTDQSPYWYLQFNLNGKQFRVSLKTTSKKRALELAKKKDAQLVLGQAEPPTAKPITLRDAVDQYLKSVAARGRASGTLGAYRSPLDVFVAYSQEHAIRYLHQVSATVLEEYQTLLQEKGFRPSGEKKRNRGRPWNTTGNKAGTVRGKLKVVRQLIKWARKRCLVKSDPAIGYDLPPAPKQQAYCWSASEVRSLLDHAETDERKLFNFLRLTGLRGDEFCWLLKEDLVVSPPHLKIRAKACPQTGKKWNPKHGNERIVPLCPEALAIAMEAAAASPGPWLFYSPDTVGKQTGRWRRGRIWARLKAAMKRAGVANGTTHTFRHVFCSFLANHGVSPYRIMKVMGHDSLDIVLMYCHATEAELIQAVLAAPFEAMLAGAAAEKGGGDLANS